MEIELHKTDYPGYNKVFCRELTEEAGGESVVPDVMPDIAELLRTDGCVFLHSKENQNGRVLLSGSVQVSVLYRAEDTACPQKLGMELPFQISAEDGTLTEDCVSVADVRLCELDARALNPRKLHVHARLLAELCAYRSVTLSFSDAAVQPNGTPVIHTKQETVSADVVGSVLEKSFILTDEFPLSGTKSPAAELLSEQIGLFPEEVRFVGNKMIFKGVVRTELIWKCEDDSLCASTFTSGFSQIMETDSASENRDVRLSLTLTGAFFELLYETGGVKAASAQLNILAQAVCTEHREIVCMTDAYCNTCALLTEADETQSFCTTEYLELRDNMRGTVELDDTVREVAASTACAGKWERSADGFTCPFQVQLLLRDTEGMLRGVERSFTAKWTLPEGTEAERLSDIRCTELYAAPASGGVEVRMLTQARASVTHSVQLSPLTGMQTDEDSALDFALLPSVTVLPEKGGDLWALAKQYHSTVEWIEKANADNPYSVLLIPKAR